MKVNEIFYSLQGEGVFTGRPAVFVRFATCNLRCPFCDTHFSTYKEMSETEIVDSVCALSTKCHFVVLTGGEPTLQVNDKLIDLLQMNGFFVAMETNGTNPVPYNMNWVTCSPKEGFAKGGKVRLTHCNELKLVFDDKHDVSDYNIVADHYYLQPCDTGIQEENDRILRKCVEYIKTNPKWKLSLQTQKIIGVQ